MERNVFLGIVALALCLAGPARALDIEVEWDAPAVQEPLGTVVTVTFEDARPPEDGGGKPRSLGEMKTARTFYIESSSGTVSELMTAWVMDGLKAEGYDARTGGDPSLPRVHVVLEELMAYGFTHFEVPIKSKVQVYPVGSNAPMWEQRLDTQGGVTLNWGPSEIVRGYEQAFAGGFPVMERLFGSAEFRAALSGVGSPAVVAAPAPAPAVAPAAAPAPAVAPAPAPAAAPIAAPVAPPPPPPAAAAQAPVGVPRNDWLSIPHIDDSTVGDASQKLRNICARSFTTTFVFFAEEDDSEWTLNFLDEDRDKLGYVNLDNEDTIEFDGDDEDCDCASGEDHEARIRLDDEEITVWVDGEEILEEELDADDECVSLSIAMDPGMFLRAFELKVD